MRNLITIIERKIILLKSENKEKITTNDIIMILELNTKAMKPNSHFDLPLMRHEKENTPSPEPHTKHY